MIRIFVCLLAVVLLVVPAFAAEPVAKAPATTSVEATVNTTGKVQSQTIIVPDGYEIFCRPKQPEPPVTPAPPPQFDFGDDGDQSPDIGIIGDNNIVITIATIGAALAGLAAAYFNKDGIEGTVEDDTPDDPAQAAVV